MPWERAISHWVLVVAVIGLPGVDKGEIDRSQRVALCGLMFGSGKRRFSRELELSHLDSRTGRASCKNSVGGATWEIVGGGSRHGGSKWDEPGSIPRVCSGSSQGFVRVHWWESEDPGP